MVFILKTLVLLILVTLIPTLVLAQPENTPSSLAERTPVPLNDSREHWQFEFGSASLYRQSPWDHASGDALSVPTVAARKGNWRFGLDHGLVSYVSRWRYAALSAGLGMRDESINSAIWDDSSDPKLKQFDDSGAEITASFGGQLFSGPVTLSLVAEQDISGESDGLTLTTQLALPLYQADGRYAAKAQWFIGGRWLDQRYSQSLYGVSAQQASADFARFDAPAALNPQWGIQWLWPINAHWLMRLRWQQEQLDNTLHDSPLVQRKHSQLAALTFTYRLSE
jgi:outer membrane scaffolding protein for murein synthesis (MipA/OmpV family)